MDHICYFVLDVVNEIDFDKTNEKYLYTAGNAVYPHEILVNIVILAALDGIYVRQEAFLLSIYISEKKK